MAKGKLDDFKIKKCPAAFAQFARQFNAQVDLLASMYGGSGLSVDFAIPPKGPVKGSNTAKPVNRGKIILTVKPTALQAMGLGTGSGTTNATNTNVIASNGTIATVTVQAVAGSSTWPTLLRVQDGRNTIINGAGVNVVTSDGQKRSVLNGDEISSRSAVNSAHALLNPGYAGAIDANGNGFAADAVGGVIYLAFTAGGKFVTIPLANVVRDLTLRTITVCDNGNSMSMDVIASAPY